MPDVTGFELAQMIKARELWITLITCKSRHSALEGRDFSELRRKQRNLEDVNRALLAEVSSRRRAEEQLRELNNTLSSASLSERLRCSCPRPGSAIASGNSRI